MPAGPSHPSAQAETAHFVAASSTTDFPVDFPLKLQLTKQDFAGVGGEHISVILAGHLFRVDVSVGSAVQMCEPIFVYRHIYVGPVEQECGADAYFSKIGGAWRIDRI